jgi:penicillin-binding protein 2
MKIRKACYTFLVFVMITTACTGNSPAATAAVSTATAAPTETPLPTPIVNVTPAPDVQSAAQKYLDAWQAEDYATMYAMLAPVSRDAISEEDFVGKYKDAAVNLTLQKIEVSTLSALTNPTTGQAAYRVRYHTSLLGELSRDTMMDLVLDSGSWKIQWEDGMIMPELKGGNHLSVDITVPARGNIYDRKGSALAAQSDAVALGIIPGKIEDGQEGKLLDQLSYLTGKTSQSIKALYKNAGPDWYIAVGEAPAELVQNRIETLSNLGGLIMNNYNTRFYYDEGNAPHVVGYVQSVPADQLEEYQRNGYRGDEKVGTAGLEKWGEAQLTGTRGASLYVVDPQGKIVTRLVQVDPKPAESIYTTLDATLQLQTQKAMEGFKGAAVVLERDTGRVLAMASSPGFDPNLFDGNNYNLAWAQNDMLNDGNQRLVNRAAQGGGYPLGSVFKIITMAAALESGLYTTDSSYNCQHTFTELPGITLNDWTLEHDVAASGELTLPQGLMRSCNPWFYHIGLDLFRQKGAKAVSDMARGFGLGSETGIEQVAENTGSMPDPASDNDAVQLAIGQGTMLVTPLQVADFVAAIGNGGTLYRPQVVEKVGTPDGDPSMTFQPAERGKLPISADTLKIIQDAMRSVVQNKRGTAYLAFTGLSVPVYGKTGTAQNPGTKAHAWFAGYTDAKQKDKPDIAIAVIAENAGEGSEIAAPIFRRIVEDYFFGGPVRLYDWESSFYVTKTPIPEETETPTPQPLPPQDTPAPEAIVPPEGEVTPNP